MHYLIAVPITIGFVVTLGVVALLELGLGKRPIRQRSKRRSRAPKAATTELSVVKGTVAVAPLPRRGARYE